MTCCPGNTTFRREYADTTYDFSFNAQELKCAIVACKSGMPYKEIKMVITPIVSTTFDNEIVWEVTFKDMLSYIVAIYKDFHVFTLPYTEIEELLHG